MLSEAIEVHLGASGYGSSDCRNTTHAGAVDTLPDGVCPANAFERVVDPTMRPLLDRFDDVCGAGVQRLGRAEIACQLQALLAYVHHDDRERLDQPCRHHRAQAHPAAPENRYTVSGLDVCGVQDGPGSCLHAASQWPKLL